MSISCGPGHGAAMASGSHTAPALEGDMKMGHFSTVMYRLPQSLEEENPVQPGVGKVVPRKAFPRCCFLFFSFGFIEI